jgi:hypothetical protein
MHTSALIEYTGLRPGDKMHGRLVADTEFAVRRVHELIFYVAVAPLHLVNRRWPWRLLRPRRVGRTRRRDGRPHRGGMTIHAAVTAVRLLGDNLRRSGSDWRLAF